MPPKNLKKQKVAINSAKPVKVSYQPPPTEEIAVTPKALPKKIMPTLSPASARPLPISGTKSKTSMWFHVALIAVAVLGFVILFIKIYTDTNQVRADIGRLDADLKAVQMDVRKNADKMTKIETMLEEQALEEKKDGAVDEIMEKVTDEPTVTTE